MRGGNRPSWQEAELTGFVHGTHTWVIKDFAGQYLQGEQEIPTLESKEFKMGSFVWTLELCERTLLANGPSQVAVRVVLAPAPLTKVQVDTTLSLEVVPAHISRGALAHSVVRHKFKEGEGCEWQPCMSKDRLRAMQRVFLHDGALHIRLKAQISLQDFFKIHEEELTRAPPKLEAQVTPSVRVSGCQTIIRMPIGYPYTGMSFHEQHALCSRLTLIYRPSSFTWTTQVGTCTPTAEISLSKYMAEAIPFFRTVRQIKKENVEKIQDDNLKDLQRRHAEGADKAKRRKLGERAEERRHQGAGNGETGGSRRAGGNMVAIGGDRRVAGASAGSGRDCGTNACWAAGTAVPRSQTCPTGEEPLPESMLAPGAAGGNDAEAADAGVAPTSERSPPVTTPNSGALEMAGSDACRRDAQQAVAENGGGSAQEPRDSPPVVPRIGADTAFADSGTRWIVTQEALSNEEEAARMRRVHEASTLQEVLSNAIVCHIHTNPDGPAVGPPGMTTPLPRVVAESLAKARAVRAARADALGTAPPPPASEAPRASGAGCSKGPPLVAEDPCDEDESAQEGMEQGHGVGSDDEGGQPGGEQGKKAKARTTDKYTMDFNGPASVCGLLCMLLIKEAFDPATLFDGPGRHHLLPAEALQMAAFLSCETTEQTIEDWLYTVVRWLALGGADVHHSSRKPPRELAVHTRSPGNRSMPWGMHANHQDPLHVAHHAPVAQGPLLDPDGPPIAPPLHAEEMVNAHMHVPHAVVHGPILHHHDHDQLHDLMAGVDSPSDSDSGGGAGSHGGFSSGDEGYVDLGGGAARQSGARGGIRGGQHELEDDIEPSARHVCSNLDIAHWLKVVRALPEETVSHLLTRLLKDLAKKPSPGEATRAILRLPDNFVDAWVRTTGVRLDLRASKLQLSDHIRLLSALPATGSLRSLHLSVWHHGDKPEPYLSQQILELLLPAARRLPQLSVLGLYDVCVTPEMVRLLDSLLDVLSDQLTALTLSLKGVEGIGSSDKLQLFQAVGRMQKLKVLALPQWERFVGRDHASVVPLCHTCGLQIMVSKVTQAQAFVRGLWFENLPKELKVPSE